ncbi:hypothetical protein [Streptomyces sp. GSL17-111]
MLNRLLDDEALRRTAGAPAAALAAQPGPDSVVPHLAELVG